MSFVTYDKMECIMKYYVIILFYPAFFAIAGLYGQTNDGHDDVRKISVLWEKGNPSGLIEVSNGTLAALKVTAGKGKIKNDLFEFRSPGDSRLEIAINNFNIDPGPNPTIVSVVSDKNPFSFFLRDINESNPVFIPEYNIIVTSREDNRSYESIRNYIRQKGLKNKLARIMEKPETSFESVKNNTRNQVCPTILGIGRDMRIFQISQALNNNPQENDIITPKNASDPVRLNGENDRPLNYIYVSGRGQSVNMDVSRYLEEGSLPILHSVLYDGDIKYHSVAFVSLENTSLDENSVKGTHYLVADYHSAGHMITENQKILLDQELEKEKQRKEETVLYYRTVARNTSPVPRYAWFKAPRPGRGWWEKIPYRYDPETGFSEFSNDKIFCVSKINYKPIPNEELAVLIQPGDSVIFEFYLPHQPIPPDRAIRLAHQSFGARHLECKNFWEHKLQRAAQIEIPEKKINDMIKAGFLHLDLITYGNEPSGTLAPTIGIYSPIGTESAPIIQFYNSMHCDDMARRSLMYFLDKQHPDGMIQNFGGYMVETGAALWSMGEYYRYTHDVSWVKKVKPKLLKSCDFLMEWRNRNKLDSLKGEGYGMISGKVADPEDQFHQYMLNGYAYLGLSRVSEMLTDIDPEESIKLKEEALAWKEDIRKSFFKDMAYSPVVPLGDGTWCPTVPPWTEATGPRALYIKPETFFSHGTFTVPDVMLGPLYLVFCEVLDPDEQASRFMLEYISELFLEQNAAFSQPYYSRHNWLQLKLGLVKPFLKTYYTTMAALADRETYTFWEHLYHASPHKTHEEAWFLMQTRWMLYFEDGNTLKLLSGIPRKWLENGKQIEIRNANTYFGNFDLDLVSKTADGSIEADIICHSAGKPEKIQIRIPHPEYKVPVKVSGGIYNRETETILINHFTGTARIKLEY